MTFYILRHQIAQYPAVKDDADLEFLSTPHCKVRNSSYEFAVLSKKETDTLLIVVLLAFAF